MNRISTNTLFLIAAFFILTACNGLQNSKKESIKAEKIQKVAYHSNRDGNFEIYSIHADGSNETRLTNNKAYDGFPSWSPDGSKILFQSDRAGQPAIFVMNANGTDVKKIPNTEGGNYAKWSPDGSKIAFFQELNWNTEIIVINPDGSNPINISNYDATDETPSWTKDGSMIAFQSNRDADPLPENATEEDRQNFAIYVMNADGTNVREVTGYEFNDENPSISPDGKQIVYQSYISGGLAVVTVEIETGKITELTKAVPPCGSPSWAGNGKKIVFDSMRDGNFDIFIMNIDGSKQTQLTFTEGENVENSGACCTQF